MDQGTTYAFMSRPEVYEMIRLSVLRIYHQPQLLVIQSRCFSQKMPDSLRVSWRNGRSTIRTILHARCIVCGYLCAHRIYNWFTNLRYLQFALKRLIGIRSSVNGAKVILATTVTGLSALRSQVKWQMIQLPRSICTAHLAAIISLVIISYLFSVTLASCGSQRFHG